MSSTTAPLKKSTRPELVLVDGAEQRRIAIDHFPFTIGRENGQDLVIPDMRVAADHAVIQEDEHDRCVILDRGSEHGTWVNGVRTERLVLRENDRIEFGAKGGPYVIFNPTSTERLQFVRGLTATSRVSIFAKLSPADLEELAKIVTLKKYEADASVVFQGEPSDGLYMIFKGSAKVRRAADDGTEKIVEILGPGEVFGELAMLDGHPRSATVTTCEATEMGLMTRQDFRAFAASRPDVLWRLMESLCERVRKTSGDLLEMSSKEVPYRLLAALNQLAEKYGQMAADGSCLIRLKTGLEDLAAMVGASREVVSHLLHKYEADGLIELGKDKKLIVPRREALARALDYASEWS